MKQCVMQASNGGMAGFIGALPDSTPACINKMFCLYLVIGCQLIEIAVTVSTVLIVKCSQNSTRHLTSSADTDTPSDFAY